MTESRLKRKWNQNECQLKKRRRLRGILLDGQDDSRWEDRRVDCECQPTGTHPNSIGALDLGR